MYLFLLQRCIIILYLLARKVRKVPQLLDRITELDDSFSSFSLQAATFDLLENLRKNLKKTSFTHVM